MEAFVIMKGSKPVRICWTAEDAIGAIDSAPDLDYFTVEIDPLWFMVDNYYKFRNLKMPNEQQAFLFLVSEIGELADSLVNRTPGWVRNNDRDRDPEKEIGDCLMMATVTAYKETGKDIVEMMVDKFKEKGYDPAEV